VRWDYEPRAQLDFSPPAPIERLARGGQRDRI
jgi:hypothetical protein